MSNIDLRKLRGRGNDITLQSDDGDMVIHIKPLPFKTYVDITQKYDKKFLNADGTEDKEAATLQQAKSMQDMIYQTLKLSYSEYSDSELNDIIDDMSFNNIMSITDSILKVNGLDNKEKASTDKDKAALEVFKAGGSPN